MNIIHSSFGDYLLWKALLCKECKDELIFVRKQILESEIQLKPNQIVWNVFSNINMDYKKLFNMF